MQIAVIFVVGAFVTAGCSSSDSSWRAKAGKGDAERKTPSQKTVAEKTNSTERSSAESVSAVRPARVVTARPANAPKWDPVGVADFRLTERSGKIVTRSDLLGKPWVTCFIFTHCSGACGTISAKMKELQEWMKKSKIDGVKIVTISVDPERDTPQRLQGYAEIFGADKDRWWFLTGKQADIFGLIRNSFGEGVAETAGKLRKPGFEVFHTSAVMLVAANGKIIARHDATNPVSMVALRQRLEHWSRTGSLRPPVQAVKPRGRHGRKNGKQAATAEMLPRL